jgi:type I restriction enzyme, S subunit
MKQGWEIKKLGEIGKVSMCKRVFKEDTTPEGDIPFYKIGTFGKSPDAFITKEKYNEFRSKFSFPKKGDILISASGTIGRRVRYDGEPAYFQDSNIVWIDNNEKQVLNDYLYRFYEICNWQSTKGATISRLYNDNLRQIEIPFPKSLSEQQRIVSLLDEAFAIIEKAKANTEQNLKNAKELFESYLQGVFEKNGDGWEETHLSKVCDFENGDRGKNYPNKSHRVSSGIPFINAGHLNENRLDFSDMDYISEERFDMLGNGKIKPNDILFCLRGSLGKVANVGYLDKGAIASSLVILRVKNGLENDFLLYFLNSNLTKKQIVDFGNGAAQPNLSAASLKKFIIPFPKYKTEQQRIVRQLDALRAETHKLEAVYQKKISDLEELKKSILQKAFAGELKTIKLIEAEQ